MRNILNGIDSAGVSDVRIIVEDSDQFCRGFHSKNVFSDEAAPQRFYGMAFGAAASRPFEHSQKGRIFKGGEDGLKLANDWGSLSRENNGCIIDGDHGKLVPSCWFRSRRRLQHLRLRLLGRIS